MSKETLIIHTPLSRDGWCVLIENDSPTRYELLHESLQKFIPAESSEPAFMTKNYQEAVEHNIYSGGKVEYISELLAEGLVTYGEDRTQPKESDGSILGRIWDIGRKKP